MSEQWQPMSVKLGEIVDTLTAGIIAGIKFLIVGNPGIGKTAITEMIAANINANVVRFFLSQQPAEDCTGYPAIINGKACHVLFEIQEYIMTPRDQITLVFLDDVGQGAMREQAAYMQFLRGFINGVPVPDNVRFIGATNDKKDKAVVSGMAEPFKSSFHTILHAVVDHPYWEKWAISSGLVRPDIIAHLNSNPHELDQFKPTTNLVMSPSPRTWVHASELLDVCESTSTSEFAAKAMIEGAIGSGACRSFFGFKAMLDAAVNPQVILADPMNANIPDNASVMYAVSLALATNFNESDKAQASMQYARRLPPEFEALIVSTMTSKNDELKNTSEYINYRTRHACLQLG